MAFVKLQDLLWVLWQLPRLLLELFELFWELLRRLWVLLWMLARRLWGPRINKDFADLTGTWGVLGCSPMCKDFVDPKGMWGSWAAHVSIEISQVLKVG